MLYGENRCFEIDYLQDERQPKYVHVEAGTSYRVVFGVEMMGPYKVSLLILAKF